MLFLTETRLLNTVATISENRNLVFRFLAQSTTVSTQPKIITSGEKTVTGHDILTKQSSSIKLTSSHISRYVFTVINGVDVLMAYLAH